MGVENLRSQKRLAAEVLGVGKRKVRALARRP
jgi:ribosomal protein L19E